jgi:hypothetical protein
MTTMKRPPRRLFRHRPPRGEGLTLINVVTTVDETDEELITTARNVAGQSNGRTFMVVMTVHGYDDDPRELHRIPEVRPLMRRLVDFGFISVLTRSSMVPELGGVDLGGFCMFGALEVWAFAEGKFGGGRLKLTLNDVRKFTEEVFPAAGEALRRNLRRYADVPADPGLILEQKFDD